MAPNWLYDDIIMEDSVMTVHQKRKSVHGDSHIYMATTLSKEIR